MAVSKPMLRGELMFPSEYVAAVELKGRDVVVTITKVEIEQIQIRGGKKEPKPVLSFRESKKRLVLNKTNAGTIAGMYGAEALDWVGKQITLFPTTTQYGREEVECIRVRPAVPKPKASQTSAPGTGTGSATAPAGEPPADPGAGDSFADEMSALMDSKD